VDIALNSYSLHLIKIYMKNIFKIFAIIIFLLIPSLLKAQQAVNVTVQKIEPWQSGGQAYSEHMEELRSKYAAERLAQQSADAQKKIDDLQAERLQLENEKARLENEKLKQEIEAQSQKPTDNLNPSIKQETFYNPDKLEDSISFKQLNDKAIEKGVINEDSFYVKLAPLYSEINKNGEVFYLLLVSQNDSLNKGKAVWAYAHTDHLYSSKIREACMQIINGLK